MRSWPDRRLLDLLNLEIPIVQAPMAGSDSVALARSVSSTGAFGSLAAALLDPDGVRETVRAMREGVNRPLPELLLSHDDGSLQCRRSEMEDVSETAL